MNSTIQEIGQWFFMLSLSKERLLFINGIFVQTGDVYGIFCNSIEI